MSAYGPLAGFYDELTADVPYGAFADYYERLFEKYSLSVHSILDAACGTGTLTYILQERGYDMVGADMSPDMLSLAAAKAEGGESPLFLCQSMEELDLYGTVDAAVCSLDGVNYVPPEVLPEALRRVLLFLEPGGVFIFDVNTPEKLRQLDGEVFIDETDDVYCVWRAEYDSDLEACLYGMDIFSLENGLWRRESEEHTEYAYSAGKLSHELTSAGFTDVRIYGELSMDAPQEHEQRIFITARKRV